ncbi:MAG: GNAT family N-acetyltransferase [Clostridia bacterium]|nr:GNAT family N-acetyltransferase [Clostridia bacterium]
MTNEYILRTALAQSAVDMNCRPEDFSKSENVIVQSAENDGARKYLQLPFGCNLVTYGGNIVASVGDKRLIKHVENYVSAKPVYRCFETPYILDFNDTLKKFGLRITCMAEYFLPDLKILSELPCAYEIRILRPAEFKNLYLEEWSNALCKDRRHLDEIAVGAYDGNKLIALAGASADCESMYQIGVDVLPEYRGKGVAGALTSRIALEILNMGKVPFYCAAWSNIKSVKNAVKCGFRPAWVELTAKKIVSNNEEKEP